MDDFEWVFEKKISRFIWARCHIKLNHAIYTSHRSYAFWQIDMGKLLKELIMIGLDEIYIHGNRRSSQEDNP